MDSWRTRRTAEDEEEEEEETEQPQTAREDEEDEEEEDERAPSVPLSLQAMGACRADERSPLSVPVPSILLPIFAGPPVASRDRLLAHLTQLFEPAEIALLVRCLCAPLVSVRVGIINKIGSLLCPIPSRRLYIGPILHGNQKVMATRCSSLTRAADVISITRGRLNLNMAPTSWLQISFIGDDGRTEQLCSISCNSSEVDNVIIEEIAADASGRSFLVKVSESQVFYYWLSEKSLSHGLDLLDKMKDILRKRPTLADLTGISTSRLDSLGTHLQACLVSPNLVDAQSIHSGTAAPSAASACTSACASTSVSTSSKNARSLCPHDHSASTSAHLSVLSSSKGGASSFKDNSSTSPSNTIGDIRDNKLMGRHIGPLVIPSLPFNSPPAEQSLPQSGAVPSLSASLPPEFSPFNPLTFQFPLPPPDHAASMDEQPRFKPQYCWCPMGPSRVSSVLPSLPPFAIPPVAASSSLSLVTPASSDCSKVLHDPLVHLPLPVSSLVIPPLPGSSQFPAFSGLMSDPIVHLPVMDISSAGQAYLVSAGPSISTAICPLVVKPLVPATESVVEKNARETLMRLLESAPMSNPIHGVAFGVDALSSAISSPMEEDMSSEICDQEENKEKQETEG